MKEIKDILIDVIRNGKRHEHYDYICERTKAWQAIVSGKGIEDYMEQFNQRESDEQFKQRVRLTKQITSSVCKNVRDIEFKVPRSNSITRVIAAGEGNQDQLVAFNQILHDFWGDSSLDDYMDTRWIELNDTDPNSFIVLEWQPFNEDEYAAPYPYEVKSEDAIYYDYDNNKLQFLAARDDDGKEFTLYGQNASIKFVKVTDEATIAKLKTVKDGDEIEMTSMETGLTVLVIRIGDNYYEIYQPEPHNLGYVPAFQPGYMRDLATNGETFLPPWWAAESVLMNLIKSKSELDLTIALHVFPQKFVYSPRCKHTGCNNGLLPSGDRCPSCKGSGWEVEHTSSQDIVRVTLPKDPAAMIELDKMIYYSYPPIDLVKFMDEYVDKLSKRAIQFVYNSEIYSREAVAETATGRNIDMQAVYDTLYPLVKAMAKDWEFMVNTISDITDIPVTCAFTFSKDFQLKSIDGYYADLSLANTAGASPYIKRAIEDKIARIEYADDKLALAKYETLKAFNPFPGDTPETIALKMSQSYVPVEKKVLYSVFGWIFDELNRLNPGFYEMNQDKQASILEARIKELVPTVSAPVFNPINTDNNVV